MKTGAIAALILALLPTAVAYALQAPLPSQVTVQVSHGGSTAQPVHAAPTAAPEATSSLDDLIHEALLRNPAVQSALHAYRAKLYRVPEVKTWPEPQVGIGWMGNIKPFSVQTGDPSSYRDVQAMERIPFPGKLGLRGDVASKEAEAAWWDYESQRRQVTAEVKAAYYQYFFLNKAIQITEKNQDLLEKLAKIAEARYRVGKGVQADVLKSQTEVSLLLQQLTVLRQNLETAKARINTLLSRTPNSALPPAAEVQPALLNYSLDELSRLAKENDTGLHREQQTVEGNQYAVKLARKEYWPDLNVAYMYEQRPTLPDMHGFTFSVEIPVFYYRKQRDALRQAAEEVVAAQRAQDGRHNDVNFEVKQQYLTATASEELLNLYAKAVVPQSSLALESSMSSYEVGKVDFLTVLANFGNVLDYQIDYYREVAAFETALAQLEPLVGVELTVNRSQSPLASPAIEEPQGKQAK